MEEGYQSCFFQGHTSCAGCGMAIIIRHVLNAAGPNTVIVNTTSCSEIATSNWPFTSWPVPYIHAAFETGGSVASGVEAALKRLKKEKVNVIVIAGDGGTYDIGLQALSGMVDRRHNVLYICYDNECYSNTGIQRSSATPYGAWTTTSPPGKFSIGNPTTKKPICEMMAVQGAVYVATSSVGYVNDIEAKVKKALTIKGPKFMLIHQPCTQSWRYDPSKTIELGKLAVETGMWVMYEIENNEMNITMEPKGKKVEEYLRAQGRFKHITNKETEEIQKHVDAEWKKYKKMMKK